MRGRDWSPTQRFKVIDGSTKPYQESIGKTIDELTLQRTQAGLWEITQDLSIADLIGSLVRLENEDTGDVIRWIPRKFMVLEYDDELRRWVDTGSTTIDKAMMILTHESHEDKLCSILAPSLRSLTRWDSEYMRGLPAVWVLLSDVWLNATIRTDDKEFASLNSKTMSDRIDLNGGLKIPGERIWLQSQLPTISLSAHLGLGQKAAGNIFELRVEESSFSGEFSGVTLEPVNNLNNPQSVSFSLANLDLPTGHYRITVSLQTNGRHKKDLASAHIGVCSANNPRSDKLASIDNQLKSEDAWYPSQDLVLYDGIKVPDFHLDEPGTSDLPPPKLRSTSTDTDNEEDYFPSHQTKPFGTTVECAHYTIFPTNEPGRNPWVYGNCQYCGAQISGAPFRYGSKDSNTAIDASKLSSLQVIRPQALLDLPVIDVSTDIDHDALFEACCYLTTGVLSEFVNLLSQVTNQTIHPLEVLQNLHSLGHLEIWREGPKGNFRWRVSAPAIVVSGPEIAYLAGYRSDDYLKEVETQVRDKGGSLSSSSQPDGPTIFTIEGLNPEQLNSVVSSLPKAFDGAVKLRWAPHLSRETFIPTKVALLDLLPEAAPPNNSDIFRPKNQTWETSPNPELPGLHRLPTRPVQHRINIDGRWRLTPYRLGKHLASHLDGISLMAYDTDSGTISCSKGSQLPCPYDKIATMCTGRLPVFDLRSKSYRYEGVPPSTASRIWRELYA